MDKETLDGLRDYAWKYFALHADQRLKTFNFYLILATVVVGSTATILKNGGDSASATLPLLLLPFLSFVFWKLDQRNKYLIKSAEAALKTLEGELGLSDYGDGPHPAKLFLREEHQTSRLKRFGGVPFWSAHLSYSTCLNLVFLVLGIGGLVVAIGLVILNAYGACSATATQPAGVG